MKKKYPHVLLDFETDRKYGRDFVKGVARYARHFGPWTFHRELPHTYRLGRKEFPDWDRIDGVIMRESPRMEEIMKRGIPLIVCPWSYDCPDTVPHTLGDYETPAAMAAEHLLEKGLQNFAYCGFEGIPSSDARRRVFCESIRKAGYPVSCFGYEVNRKASDWETEKLKMSLWIRDLPKPVGIMANTDDWSRMVEEACHWENLKIPDEVAIIGVDNDELVCELSSPRLSSVNMNSEAAGYDTAALLARMMKGETPDVKRIIAQPTEVITRQSSDILAVEDEQVSAAIRFIRNNAGRIIDVEDVVQATTLSRRVLEMRFRENLGKTVHSEIRKTRALRIAQILRETDYPVSRIALNLGYSGEDHIARFFSKEMGMTPRAYRNKGQSKKI